MKTKHIITILTAISAALTPIAAADTLPLPLKPDTQAMILAGVAVLLQVIRFVGDLLDDGKINQSFGNVIIVGLTLGSLPFLGGCATLERVRAEQPLLYEGGKAFIKLALHGAANAFLEKNPEFREGFDVFVNGLAGMAPQDAVAAINERLPEDKAAEFGDLLAAEVEPVVNGDAPASDEGTAWVMQVALRL